LAAKGSVSRVKLCTFPGKTGGLRERGKKKENIVQRDPRTGTVETLEERGVGTGRERKYLAYPKR